MKLKHFILILAVSFLFSEGMGQVVFQRTYGGLSVDHGKRAQQTADGGYFIAGLTRSFGAGLDDFILLKLDVNGDTMWTRTYGGASGESVYSAQQTYDGGYIIAGSSLSFGSTDIYVIKTDANGDTIWTKKYGGASIDVASSIQQTTDSGYIITGGTYSYGAGFADVFLIKTNVTGDTLWTRIFGGYKTENGSCVQQTIDGGYVITGTTSSYGVGSRSIFLIKTDDLGNLLWSKTYEGTIDEDGISVIQTADTGYAIIGTTYGFGFGEWDAYLIKTDAAGDVMWAKIYGGIYAEEGRDILQTSDGGYIFTGFTTSFGAGAGDVYLVKTNPIGDTLWTKAYGGPIGDRAFSVEMTADGGYIITGLSLSFGAGGPDIYLLKIDAFGNSGSCNEYSTATLVGNSPVIATSQFPIIGFGGTRGNPPTVVSNASPKDSILCNSVGIQSLITNNQSTITIYPNPFTTSTTVEINSESSDATHEFALYDQLGRQVRHIVSARSSFVLERESLPAGIYFYALQSKGQQFGRGKLVIY